MAVVVCVSFGALTLLGLRATYEWRDSSRRLLEGQATETANLLATALTHDMRAAQSFILPSYVWAEMTAPGRLFAARNRVASAFARYPYPEVFFVGRAGQHTDGFVFFARSDRPPAWDNEIPTRSRHPVAVITNADVAQRILDLLKPDIARGRRWSAIELDIDGVAYQVVSLFRYVDVSRQQLAGTLGIMVNLSWAREHYFPEFMEEVVPIGLHDSGLSVAVVDDRGDTVFTTQPHAGSTPLRERPFQMTFHDPSLLPINAAVEQPLRNWKVVVSQNPNLALLPPSGGPVLMLVAAALATGFFSFGVFLTARAIQAHTSLADMRTDFMSSVTHELKTPIATIQAAGTTLEADRAPDAETRREMARLVVQESKRLSRLVNNLLAFVRISDVADIYSFEPLSLETLVSDALERYSPQLLRAGATVRVRIDDDLPLIRADQTAMELLCDNLIDNAVRHSVEAPVLQISARGDESRVVLEVTDQGRGIPGDELERVTQKFFRGRDAAAGGTGLGLAIVQRIVTDHGGSLAIRSRVGVGTTFTVSFEALANTTPTTTRDEGLPACLPDQ